MMLVLAAYQNMDTRKNDHRTQFKEGSKIMALWRKINKDSGREN